MMLRNQQLARSERNHSGVTIIILMYLIAADRI